MEPKGHLRLKNDMRYVYEEIIPSESSKSAHDNNHREKDDDNDKADDEENSRFVRNDAYNENNNMDRDGNSESESADAEFEEEETDNDNIEGIGHQNYSPHGREYPTDDNTAEYMGQPRNSESESADSELEEEEEEADDDNDNNIERVRKENYYPREQEYRMGQEDSESEDSELEEEAPDARESEDANDDNAAENVVQDEGSDSASSSDKDNNERMEINPRQKIKQTRDEVHAGKEPQPESVATTDVKKEPLRMFHILETRFMQNQPDLVQLAKARLQLFKAICLPTVVQQTAWGNFLWIIRTDPDLHIDIRRELVEILNESGALTTKTNDTYGIEERALTYVIGSNDNYIVANSTTVNPQIRPFDIHDMFSNMLSKPDKIFAGKVENIKSTLDGLSSEAKDVVLWTRLDADDGLSVDFLKYIQDQMMLYFVPGKAKDVNVDDKEETEKEKEEEENIDFRYIDSEDHDSADMKERADGEDNEELSKLKNDTVTGDKAANEDEEGEEEGAEENDDESNTVESPPYSPPNWMYWCGGQNIDWFLTDPIHDPKHDTGVVYPVLHANVCVTPGLTVAFRGDIAPALVPKLDHDKIVSYLSDVGGEACNRTGLLDHEQEQDDDEVLDDGSCFQMIHGWTHAVRSRTPTSAGMMGVNPDENQLQMVLRNKGIKKLMWRQMHKKFLLNDDDLRKTNSYFAKHVYDIAEENARGQCTNGHSCKVSCIST